MRKIIVMIMSFCIGLQSKSQGPVLPYKDAGYSVVDMKDFLSKDTEKAKQYKKKIVAKVKKAMSDHQYQNNISESDCNWILDHVVYKEKKLHLIKNTGWDGKNIYSFDCDEDYEGFFGFFEYEEISLVLYKARCANFVEIKEVTTPVITKKVAVKPKPESPEKKVVIETVRKDTARTVINNYTYNNNTYNISPEKQHCCTSPEIAYQSSCGCQTAYVQPRTRLNVQVGLSYNNRQVYFQPTNPPIIQGGPGGAPGVGPTGGGPGPASGFGSTVYGGPGSAGGSGGSTAGGPGGAWTHH